MTIFVCRGNGKRPSGGYQQVPEGGSEQSADEAAHEGQAHGHVTGVYL